MRYRCLADTFVAYGFLIEFVLSAACTNWSEMASSEGTQVAAARSATTAAPIAFVNVSKRYPGRTQAAVGDLSFEVPSGEICVLIGPSGCGKTTALKMVNRLIPMTEGDITIDGRSINAIEVSQLRRGIGYVFQQIGLFPHMTVEDNIGTVPRLLGWSKASIRERAIELLQLVGLGSEDSLRRYPAEFSGGQQQRIGVARAMAVDPPIMLMDEPFGAIDPITRDRLQDDFLRLHREVRKTIIFVTHDIDEAIKMGDRIAIMRDGRLVQIDTPDNLLAAPGDEFVADFVGADRGLKRLRVWTLGDLDLDPLPENALPSAPSGTSLRDALSLMLTAGATRVAVLGQDGTAAGSVSLEAIAAMLGPRPEAAAP
jgi:osmoprotectant transport system ATP-binding protein